MTAATTTTTQPIRGTAKALRTRGLDLSKPVMMFGYSIDGPNAGGNRYESVTASPQGVHGIKADGTKAYLGGVATRFWLVQIVEAPAPAAAAAPAAAPAAEDAELDRMSFAELMVIAKALKVPGRGTARIDALRAGIRTAREVAARAVARSERAAAAAPGTSQLSGWGELAAAHRAGMAS